MWVDLQAARRSACVPPAALRRRRAHVFRARSDGAASLAGSKGTREFMSAPHTGGRSRGDCHQYMFCIVPDVFLLNYFGLLVTDVGLVLP